ncbi:Serine/threonine-protein kinase HT1 [Hordeum vulgare]|nr:Serine/threonine-protein kinase HT1 [Hordeum vulgare]
MSTSQPLDFLVPKSRIEANPEKMKAIKWMARLTNQVGVQKITDYLTSLSCFSSRLGEKALPLYRVIKEANNLV